METHTQVGWLCIKRTRKSTWSLLLLTIFSVTVAARATNGQFGWGAWRGDTQSDRIEMMSENSRNTCWCHFSTACCVTWEGISWFHMLDHTALVHSAAGIWTWSNILREILHSRTMSIMSITLWEVFIISNGITVSWARIVLARYSGREELLGNLRWWEEIQWSEQCHEKHFSSSKLGIWHTVPAIPLRCQTKNCY